MAIPQVRAVGTVVVGNGGDPGVVLPTHAADDILLLPVETTRDTDTIGVSTAGWAEVTGSPQAVAGSPDAQDALLAWFWKRAASSSETNPVITGASGQVAAVGISVSGCITTGDPWDVTSAGGALNSSVTIPGATTTVADCLVMIAVATSRDANQTDTTFSSWANADLANIAELVDRTFLLGGGGGLGVATGEKATAGAYGDTTVTSAATEPAHAYMTIALKPPAAGGTTVEADLTDGAEASDTFADRATFRPAVTDGAEAGDTLSARASLHAAVTEGAEAGDVVAAVLRALASVTEGAEAGESFAAVIKLVRALSEGGVAGDSVAAVLRALAATSEGAEAGDTVSALATLRASLSEGAAAGDTFSAVVLSALSGILTEGALAGDSVSALASLHAAFTEGARAGDIESAVLHALASMSEGAVASDTVTALVKLIRQIEEGAVAGESYTVRAVLRPDIVEGAIAGDTYVCRVNFVASITEGALAGDIVATGTLGVGPFCVHITVTHVSPTLGVASRNPSLSSAQRNPDMSIREC